MNPAAIQFPNSKQTETDDMDSGDEDITSFQDDKSLALLPYVSAPLRETTIHTYRWVDEIVRNPCSTGFDGLFSVS